MLTHAKPPKQLVELARQQISKQMDDVLQGSSKAAELRPLMIGSA